MARPGVTYLEVATAALQLSAAGKNPTVETIRIALGTGSNSTLGTHLRAWKARQGQTQQIATKERLPEELIAVIKGLWERVIDQSDEKIQAIQEEVRQELAQATHEVERLQRDNTHWQQQYQQNKQERHSLANEKSALEQRLSHANLEIATLTGKQSGLEQQGQEKQARIDELHRQNQQVQANLKHYRTSSLEQRLADQQRHEQHQQQLEQTMKHMNQELTQVKHEKSVCQQQSQQAIVEKDTLKAQLDKLEAQQASLTAQLTAALNEVARKTQDQQHWQTQCHTLQTEGDERAKQFLELQTQYAVLSQQCITLKAELQNLSEQNKVLAHEKWTAWQEKFQLDGQVKQMQELLQHRMKAIA